MARDGNGNYTKAEPDFVGGSVINATSMNNNFDDIAVALTNSIAKNGETKITGDIDFNNNKAVNVKDATASADATNLKVIQNRVGVHGTSSGTDTITLTLSPAISDYVAGQEFTFKAGGTNTGATTLNINAKGAKNVLTQQGLALTANSIVANKFYKVRYDGTSFILLNDIPINVLTEKTTLVDNDLALIEDSEASNARKKTKLSSVWNYIKSKIKFINLNDVNISSLTVGKTFQVVDVSGTPKIQQVDSINAKSAFMAYPSANISDETGDGTIYTIIHNTVSYNIGNDYNKATGEYAAPVDGVYSFLAGLYIGNSSAAAGHTDVRLTLGTSTFGAIHQHQQVGTQHLRLSVGIDLKLDAGDKIYTSATVTGGTKTVRIVVAGGQTFFAGHLIREL